MQREVKFTVAADGGITPAAPQYAGVQGEHKATVVLFDVSAWAAESFIYRAEYVSGAGEGDTTDVLVPVDNIITVPLLRGWTMSGGVAVVRLVASVVTDDEETQTVFAVDARVYYRTKEEITEQMDGVDEAGLTQLILETQNAADTANTAAKEILQMAESGAFNGTDGKDGVDGKDGKDGAKGDDGEVFLPQGECGGDSVSIGSNTVSPHVAELTDGMVILQTFTTAVPQYSGVRILQLSADNNGDGTGSPVIARFRDDGEEELPAGTYLLRYDAATDHMVVAGQMITGGSALEEKVATLEEQVADLLYVPIEVTAINNSVGTVEIGSVVDEVTLTWSLNKTPVQQTAGARSVDNDARTITLTGLGLTNSASFEVVATDERGTVARKATNVNVRRGVYYGVPAVGAAADSATILALSRSLQSGRAITFTVTAGEGQHIAFALPTSYGTPTFTVGGFDGGFTKAATVSHTNASGHTEDYDLWLSDNTGLGVTTVVVR